MKIFKLQPNKNVIFSCSHCSCTISVLISYSFDTQIILIFILIDVQYSQYSQLSIQCCFQLWKSFELSKSHLLRFSPPGRKIPPQQNFWFPSPTCYHYLENPAPTESLADGTLLCITNHLSYKPCFDLNIYKSNELESTFTEILNAKESNIIIICIYKYPLMDFNDLNTNYLNNHLDKVSNEQKFVFLLSEFNINLFKVQ